MIRFVFILVLASSLALAEPPTGGNGDAVKQALETLARIQSDLELVRHVGLHQEDVGRLLTLEKSGAEVAANVQAHGLLNMKTFDLYREMCSRFRYSVKFFDFIRTPRTEATLADLLTLVQGIRDQMQLADYMTLIHSTLTEMMDALQRIVHNASVSKPLRDHLTALVPQIGDGISIGAQGDRPEAFAAATRVYWSLHALYPELREIASGTAASDVLELLGLNQFIAEYAQI